MNTKMSCTESMFFFLWRIWGYKYRERILATRIAKLLPRLDGIWTYPKKSLRDHSLKVSKSMEFYIDRIYDLIFIMYINVVCMYDIPPGWNFPVKNDPGNEVQFFCTKVFLEGETPKLFFVMRSVTTCLGGGEKKQGGFSKITFFVRSFVERCCLYWPELLYNVYIYI